jgi:biopolymer transport protein ExbD
MSERHVEARLQVAFATFALSVLLSMPASAQTHGHAPRLEIIAMNDGSLVIEGGHFATVQQLQTKLSEVSKREPRPYLAIETERGATLKQVGKAILMIAQTGYFPKVGFLIEPRKVPPPKTDKPAK